MAKAYHSFDEAMKKRFGQKIYKLSLDAGCTCPNRDGKCGFGGCAFCADEAYATSTEPIYLQIEKAKEKVGKKIKNGRYIAYFQNHTNTYGDMNHLKRCFEEALEPDEIVALSVGTRPDCIDDDVISMLTELRNKYNKPVWIELGLQTIHENTAILINRGYTLPVFDECYKKLKENGFEVIIHVIIGLPAEGEQEIFQTVRYVSSLNPVPDGIKLQLLHILKGTAFYEMYKQNPDFIHEYKQDEYIDLVRRLIRILPEETVVHRITGDGPRKLLVTPLWTTDKKRVINEFRKALVDIEKE